MDWVSVVLTNVFSWIILLFGISFPVFLILGMIGLTGFREVSRFELHNTFYYRLNPITKLALGLVVMVIATITIWWVGLIMSAVLLASYLTLKNGVRKLFVGLYLTTATILGVTWTFAPYTPFCILRYAEGTKTFTPIWTWPAYFSVMGVQNPLTLQALLYGFQISMRFSSIFLAALLLIMTSTPSEILRALQKFKIPILLIFSLVVAMRTVPRIFDSLDTAVKVQFMRGLGSATNPVLGVFYMIIGAFQAIVPAMIFLFRGAKNTAISADTRAFRAYPKRTFLRPMVFNRVDAYMFAGMLLVFALSVVGAYVGFGRGIPYQATFGSCTYFG